MSSQKFIKINERLTIRLSVNERRNIEKMLSTGNFKSAGDVVRVSINRFSKEWLEHLKNS